MSQRKKVAFQPTGKRKAPERKIVKETELPIDKDINEVITKYKNDKQRILNIINNTKENECFRIPLPLKGKTEGSDILKPTKAYHVFSEPGLKKICITTRGAYKDESDARKLYYRFKEVLGATSISSNIVEEQPIQEEGEKVRIEEEPSEEEPELERPAEVEIKKTQPRKRVYPPLPDIGLKKLGEETFISIPSGSKIPLLKSRDEPELVLGNGKLRTSELVGTVVGSAKMLSVTQIFLDIEEKQETATENVLRETRTNIETGEKVMSEPKTTQSKAPRRAKVQTAKKRQVKVSGSTER